MNRLWITSNLRNKSKLKEGDVIWYQQSYAREMFRTERATPIEWDVELRHYMQTQNLVVTSFENLLCSDLRSLRFLQTKIILSS